MTKSVMPRLAGAVMCVMAVVVAQLWTGRASTAGTVSARTPIKWLINTGNLAGRWPPPTCRSGRKGCENNTATPNTISRMQMIRGGTAAVLVMPTGDGGHRCCADGTLPQFSLGLVVLQHGHNNLYPVVQPFPEWRAFVDADPPAPEPEPGQDRKSSPKPAKRVRRSTGTTCDDEDDDDDDDCGDEERGNRRIVNAVDAFLDERGRILWVLDAGSAGEDACHGHTSSGGDRSASDQEIDDRLLLPKFVAIDVYTNQIIDIVSLSRVWQPGVSCFQYIISVYLDAEDNFNSSSAADSETTGGSGGCNLDWPLVVVGDAGTNRVLVYTHSNDKFAEIILPLEENRNALHDAEDKVVGNDAADGRRKLHPNSRWPTPPIRDILYLAPLSVKPGRLRLLITYHGCREVYKLRLQLSNSDPLSYEHDAGTTPVSLSPIIGTLAVLGRKPCRMVILGTDRRQTDVVGESFAGGGTTVYFRLENTNDIWSWKVLGGKKRLTGSFLFIDERDFRLVRLGRTCRVPIAISASPAAVGNGDADHDAASGEKTAKRKQIRQIVWMLETNFIDHFAGTADHMGANAKLQPLETPLYYDVEDDANAPAQMSPLRVQPTNDFRLLQNTTFRRRRHCSITVR